MNGYPPPPAPVHQPITPLKAKSRSGPRSRSSPYKGVTQYRRTGKWEAHIWIPGGSRGKGHQRHLGSYHTAEDAARCFDRATIHVRGTKEELNFPLQEYAEDQFMLEHARTEKFKFLDMMRAKFAIPSALPAGRKSYRARSPRPRPTPRARKVRGGRSKSSIYSDEDEEDDDQEDEEDDYSDDPEYAAAKGTAKRPAPSPSLAPPGYLRHPHHPHTVVAAAAASPRSATTTAAAMLFKQQNQSPVTPYQSTPNGQHMIQSVGFARPTGLSPRSTSAVNQTPHGRQVMRVSDLARMSMRKLSNYANQRAQQPNGQQQYHHRGGVAEEEEDGDEEEDVDDDNAGHGFRVHAPQLFSSPPSIHGWGAGTTRETTPTVGITKPHLSFASTLGGLPVGPAAPAVLPTRIIGSAFTAGPTCGAVRPSSASAFPSTVYTSMHFQTGAAAAHALQETFYLPPLLETAGGGNGGSDGASTGSGDGPLTADDLLAGIQMFSGGQDPPPSQDYKDWLCNSPCEVAPSPSTAV